MLGYLKRLVTTGAAYQFGDIVAKGLALLTLPLYTHHLNPEAYGAAESLLTAVILSSILLRVGVGEAFIRFYFDDEDIARRERIARTATATVAWTTTIAALLALALAAPLSHLLLGFRDPLLLDCAVLGLWAFTNLEMAYAQLRVDERARAYILASGANVAMTVAFTITLVVFADQGARGLLLGNFSASALVVLGLWWTLRRRFSLRVRTADLRAMLSFGLPTIPADASVYALQVADRFYLLRSYSHTAAGLYAVAIKLATVVFVAVRGFQYAWPPLAYSIEDDEEAGRLYSLVTTYYALATGVVVCGVALLGRWMVRLLAAHRYIDAYKALPWLALGWALYGLYLVFVAISGPCAGDLPQPAGGACGPGRQRDPAGRARALQRRRPGHRRRRHRALRRLHGDAARDVRPHPQPLQGRLRMGPSRAARRDPRGGRGLWRAAAPQSRLVGPAHPRGGLALWPGSRWSRSGCCRVASSTPMSASRLDDSCATGAPGSPPSVPATARSRPMRRIPCATSERPVPDGAVE